MARNTSSPVNSLWRVIPTSLPKIARHCPRCGVVRALECTGKFRVNANGRRIDIWLIYRCAQCGERWNRPVFDRIATTELAPLVLQMATENDPSYARELAFSERGLTSLGLTLYRNTPYRLSVEKFIDDCDGSPGEVNLDETIEIRLEAGIHVRLDRLLSGALSISREEVKKRLKTGAIEIDPVGRKAHRRPVQDGQRIIVR